MSKKNQNKKLVRFIPSKIKEIPANESSESNLEKNIEELEEPNDELFDSSSSSVEIPLLRRSDVSDKIESSNASETKRQAQDPAFSQSISYGVRAPQAQRVYEQTETSTSRRFSTSFSTAILPEAVNESQRPMVFSNDELAHLRNQDLNREYENPFEMRKEKPKRMYPWEVS